MGQSKEKRFQRSVQSAANRTVVAVPLPPIPTDRLNQGNGDLSNLALVLRLLRLSWQPRLQMITILTIQIVMLTMLIGGLSLTGVGIDVIRYHMDPQASLVPRWPIGLAPPAHWSSMAIMVAIAAGIIAMALLRAILRNRYTITLGTLVQGHVVVDLRKQVYDKLQQLSFRFFDGNESGSIINRVTSDVQNVAMFIRGVLFDTINLVIAMAIFIVLMLSIHVHLTLACLTTMPLLWVCTVIFSKLVRKDYQANRLERDNLVLTLSENIQGVHVVKGFARQGLEKDKFAKANGRVTERQHRIFWRVSVFSPTIEFITQISMIILLSYGGYLAIYQDLPVGTGLFVLAGLLSQFSTRVQQIARISNRVQDCLTSAARVFEVLDAPLEIESPANPHRIRHPRGAVKFEGVTFGYRLGDQVLHNLAFEVKPGQCVAVLGPTAAGKSTLLSLIPRFYDPTSGRILIDGINVRQMDLDDLRRQIGIVFQESFLFSNTVAANIAFGHPEATRAQLEHAARIAASHDFITALPDGYQTVIGERGIDLSGGQRQRLAIARAVLLEPRILLLDDPTASIDPETEDEILHAMETAMQDRTTFVVAHRLSTLRRADMVVVLDRGRIVQMGTHRDLMQSHGQYRDAAVHQVADSESKRLLGVT